MKKIHMENIQHLILGLAAGIGQLMPVLACMLIMYVSKDMISTGVKNACVLSGSVGAFLLFAVYFYLRYPKKGQMEKKISVIGMVARKSLWILAIFSLWQALVQVWGEVREDISMPGLLFFGVLLILTVLCCLAAACILAELAQGMRLKEVFSHPLYLLSITGIIFVLLIGVTAIAAVIDWIQTVAVASVPGLVAEYVLLTYGEYLLLKMASVVMYRPVGQQQGHSDTETAEEDVKPEQEVKRGKFPVGQTVSILLALFLSIFLSAEIRNLEGAGSAETWVADSIEACVEQGNQYLEQGDLDQTIACYEQAELRRQAFERAASGESVKELYDANRQDIVIGALYYSEADSLGVLEQEIRTGSKGDLWYPVLLHGYKGKQDLTKEQEALKRQALYVCMASGRFTDTAFYLDEIAGSEKKIEKVTSQYQEVMVLLKAYQYLKAYQENGAVTVEQVSDALEAAEEYPENLLLQYIAIKTGSAYQIDGASHYDRTVEAVRRFDKLYDDGKKDSETLANEKTDMGDVAALCYDFETALTYYEAAAQIEPTEERSLLCARMLFEEGEYEQAYQNAKEIPEAYEDYDQALYLMSVSALKEGDVEQSLEAMERLADLLTGQDTYQEQTELYLYDCIQYYTMLDNSHKTGVQGVVYEQLTEQQLQEIQSHELLWDYMTAVYQSFYKTDEEGAVETAERILRDHTEYAYVWYIKGCAEYQSRDYENALSSFQTAEACQGTAPAILYAIESCYDAMEDYQNAYVYTRKIAQILPYQDHGTDIYGIAVHNQNLATSLEFKLKE